MDITLTTHNNKVDTLKWPMTSLIHIHFKVVLQPLALTQFPRRADLFIMRAKSFSRCARGLRCWKTGPKPRRHNKSKFEPRETQKKEMKREVPPWIVCLYRCRLYGMETLATSRENFKYFYVFVSYEWPGPRYSPIAF
jgi:hypothetical protein